MYTQSSLKTNTDRNRRLIFLGETMRRIVAWFNEFYNDEGGQGLVEYLLIVVLVALAATAGMNSAASYINSAFIRIGAKLGTYVS